MNLKLDNLTADEERKIANLGPAVGPLAVANGRAMAEAKKVRAEERAMVEPTMPVELQRRVMGNYGPNIFRMASTMRLPG